MPERNSSNTPSYGRKCYRKKNTYFILETGGLFGIVFWQIFWGVTLVRHKLALYVQSEIGFEERYMYEPMLPYIHHQKGMSNISKTQTECHCI
jgi:hypothetical protein